MKHKRTGVYETLDSPSMRSLNFIYRAPPQQALAEASATLFLFRSRARATALDAVHKKVSKGIAKFN